MEIHDFGISLKSNVYLKYSLPGHVLITFTHASVNAEYSGLWNKNNFIITCCLTYSLLITTFISLKYCTFFTYLLIRCQKHCPFPVLQYLSCRKGIITGLIIITKEDFVIISRIFRLHLTPLLQAQQPLRQIAYRVPADSSSTRKRSHRRGTTSDKGQRNSGLFVYRIAYPQCQSVRGAFHVNF